MLHAPPYAVDVHPIQSNDLPDSQYELFLSSLGPLQECELVITNKSIVAIAHLLQRYLQFAIAAE